MMLRTHSTHNHNNYSDAQTAQSQNRQRVLLPNTVKQTHTVTQSFNGRTKCSRRSKPKSPVSPLTKHCQTDSCTDTPLPSPDQLVMMLRTHSTQSHGDFVRTVTNCFSQLTNCSTCSKPTGQKQYEDLDQMLTEKFNGLTNCSR